MDSKIQRYGNFTVLGKSRDGDYVLFSDHERRERELLGLLRDSMKALDAMVNERYSELDMMSCKYPRGSSEAIAWELGVRQAWKLWDLSKQPGVDMLAKLRTDLALAEREGEQ